MEKYILITTTTKKKSDAEEISMKLVELRLAACVQIIGPVKSTYWWKGAIESIEEWLCIIKTKRTLYREIERFILKVHPYEVPEVVSVPIIHGSEEYLSWLHEELKK